MNKVVYDLTFESMLKYLKYGYIAYREGWNGKKQHIFMRHTALTPSLYEEDKEQINHIAALEKTYIPYDAAIVSSHIMMVIYKDLNNIEFRPWLASQADMLTSDWIVAK